MKLFICQFCGRETTNTGANKAHENRCTNNPTPKPKLKSGRKPGYKGENQYTKAKKLCLPKPIRSEQTINKLRISNTGKNTLKKLKIKYLKQEENIFQKIPIWFRIN